ncbi:hypothetical protein CIL05_10070 [Virgibacillus profundi]|uniref:Uncharacterized protein n=1 Tax=Virgibacillus profundi TaxID=2024555 RepID=A0A2A2IEB6_9BACI|nr:hypothetical protein [Virgibacillus profundi]PAV29708.1 hypothetical protein CIL05_10070 [Virgibacillus profundi]PXY53880.1 hypothetical protein CIT14_10170 [Virgibacillus profundi]
MNRNITVAEKLFVTGLGLILLFMLFHDWLPLGNLNDIHGIQEVNTLKELIVNTIINVVSILVVTVIALLFIGKRYPIWAKVWLIIHLGSIFYGALSAWWIPYLFGAVNERIERYSMMFGETHTFLPVMNGIVLNTIHVLFHLILLITWILSIYISFKFRNMYREAVK